MVTVTDVAQFMVDELKKQKFLYQEAIVFKIKQNFGEPFYYTNKNGNFAIAKEVLKEFKELTPDVKWDSGERCWRFKTQFDKDTKKRQSTI
ncbi:MAG: hypothetical protein RBT49_11165 [Bacteroidales bacterium]|jgi:hypothetical protein|nr:hypothetical protein [Bacteroidales bacterium]